MGELITFKVKVKKMNATAVRNVTINDVAQYFLSQESMTHKKLQKLCYYAYAWNLALHDEYLFTDKFQAWVHGPVSPGLYQEYKVYGWNEIPQPGELPQSVQENERIMNILELVYNSYRDFDGDELEILTHQEDPWLNARGGIPEHFPSNSVIEDRIIREYYRNVFEADQNI
ncbi:TPA: DUF4065 domain-containing protein [Bacillus cereus]|uniref:Panacea domain-containing protein n=1 Tax=Bacillus cereus group TaxID=86661 RepID=UPI001F587631|nr:MULTISPECIES: type II toxin-antitoxin system antitoxin SocA domain-containing protein [Bacillus cereus group]MEB4819061.1 DUF4065 domain-containing protein [Bacillus thuringiensis]UNP78282.1 DUF4065 domain-containing protein [Bacillus nitratireducens]HDR8486315.1 DUF4065 domain-containing protein [Bacillus cereus]